MGVVLTGLGLQSPDQTWDRDRGQASAGADQGRAGGRGLRWLIHNISLIIINLNNEVGLCEKFPKNGPVRK